MARINSKALKPRLRKIRRVVTGHDREARSVIASDASSPHVMTLQGIPTFGVTEIWKTTQRRPITERRRIHARCRSSWHRQNAVR